MKKLAVVIAGLLVLTGCSSVEPESVSYPVQTEENAQNKQQTEDVSLSEESPSVIESEPESVDAPIVEEEVVQEDVQVSEPARTDAPSSVEEAYNLSYEIVEDDVCKLKEVSSYRSTYKEALASSFPSAAYSHVPYVGKVKVSYVFVDWKDLRGTQEDYNYHIEQMQMIKDFYWNVSEGALDLQMDVSREWFTVDDSYVSYITPDDLSGGGNHESVPHLQKIADAFIEASDSGVDYSDAEIVIFAIPRAEDVWLGGGLHSFGAYGGQSVIRTDEGNIYTWFSGGSESFNEAQPVWATLVHEMAHAFGIPDLRNWGDRSINEAWYVNPMLNYDIMDVQTSIQRTISSWIRWVQGWMSDSQVTCVLKEDIDDDLYSISHLDTFGAKDKSLVIKINSTTALVVESRRWRSKWDVPAVNSTDGVIVYRVDANMGHSQGPMRLVAPNGRDITQYLREPNTYREWRALNVIFKEGDRVTIDGVTLQVEDIGSGRDIVRISK